MTKKVYRVRNWKEYNKGLVNRGSLTFWFSEDLIGSWQPKKDSDNHGNQKYTDSVILCGLTLRQLYRLPLRATTGLLRSLLTLMKVDFEVPNYSTLSKRGKTLKVSMCSKSNAEARHILVDSTDTSDWRRRMEKATSWRKSASIMAEITHCNGCR